MNLVMHFSICSQSRMKALSLASVVLNGMLLNYLLSSWRIGVTKGNWINMMPVIFSTTLFFFFDTVK